MWQRVQTLYLALATILVGSMFFCTKAVTLASDGSAAESFGYISYVPYLIFLIIITLLNLLALTTYKVSLVFPMRTAILSALLTIALQIWLAVDFLSMKDVMVFRISAVFPAVSVIFDVLAARAIMSDQMIVESASHLRKARRERRSGR